MDRRQLEHVIRAVGDLLGVKEVIVIGSQAILGAYPDDLPRSVLRSREVDVAPIDGDEVVALRINGAVGELTLFDKTYGYYAEGVTLDVATLPEGWRDRLIPVSSPATNGVTGLCLEPHDLCIAKLAARREKDIEFVAALVQSGHVKREVLLERLGVTEMPEELRQFALKTITGMGKPGRRSKFRRALRDVQRGPSNGSDDPELSLEVDDLVASPDVSSRSGGAASSAKAPNRSSDRSLSGKHRCPHATRSGEQCKNELLGGSVCPAHGWRAPS
jgi:hypothetical protein